jgi:hypothetical protein
MKRSLIGLSVVRSLGWPPVMQEANCLWKKPSMAFFHECEPQKSRGFWGSLPPDPAADHLFHRQPGQVRTWVRHWG